MKFNFAIFWQVFFVIALVIGMSDYATAHASEGEDYVNQKSEALVGVGVVVVDVGIVKATPAPEAPKETVPEYDPAETDEGMGEEGFDESDIPEGWVCDGPAYLCRGEDAEKEREKDQQDWLDEQDKEEAEAEANAPHTCEGSGTFGDYSPEGYEGCPGR